MCLWRGFVSFNFLLPDLRFNSFLSCCQIKNEGLNCIVLSSPTPPFWTASCFVFSIPPSFQCLWGNCFLNGTCFFRDPSSPHHSYCCGRGTLEVPPRLGHQSPLTHSAPKPFHSHLNAPLWNQNWAWLSLMRTIFLVPPPFIPAPHPYEKHRFRVKSVISEVLLRGTESKSFPSRTKGRLELRSGGCGEAFLRDCGHIFSLLAPRLLHRVLLPLSCLIMTETLIDSFGT